MNTYREADLKRKNDVVEFLAQSAAQLEKQGSAAEAESLQKLCENVKEDRFSIVVVGEFSAGKSTFLNAMMHKKILPSFSGETTATVNFLMDTSCAPHGEAGIVYYREPEGKTEVLPDLNPETVENVVSVRGNRKDRTVASTIDHVDLFLDSAFLKDGVMLVDSPGLNGNEEHHKEITEEQIRKSHACIYLFNARQPGSKTNFTILRELKARNNNVLFVLNQIDVIRKEEGNTPESVVAILNEEYHRQFPEDRELPHIWPLSAGMALEARDPELSRQKALSEKQRAELEQRSRIGEFEDRLWKYLTQGERRRDQLCAPMKKTLETLKAEMTRLNGIVALLNEQTGAEELLKRQSEIQAIVDSLQKEREHTSGDLRKRMSGARRHLQESAAAKCSDLSEEVNRKLDQQETLPDVKEYGEQLGSRLQWNYMKIASELNEELQQELVRMISEEYEDYAEALENRFAESESTAAIHIEPKEFRAADVSTRLDLEKFEKERERLKAQIEQIEKQRDCAEDNSLKARRKERELKEYQRKLERLQESKTRYEMDFVVPAVETRGVSYYESEKRHGIVGRVANVLVGEKQVQKTKTETISTAHDMAVKEKNAALDAINEEINEIEQKASAVREELTEDSEFLTRRAERLDRKLEEENRKYDNMLKDMDEQLDQEQKVKLRKLRQEIKDGVEKKSDSILKEIKKYLQEQEKTYIQMVQDAVTVNINEELEKNRKALQEVQQALNGEARERDEKRKNAQENLKATSALIQKGADIFTDLEASLDDHVEQEES